MRHEGGVLAVTFTPDGRRVLTGGRDRTARFWSAETGEPLGQPMEFDGWVAELHFSRDGSKVLGRTYGHSAAVWSANLGAELDVELKEQPLLAGVFSPDGLSVLTANILGEARVWSAQTGEPTGLVVKHRMWNVDYRPDGQCFLTAGRDGLVKFWSAATGEPWGQPLIHSTHVRAAVFSHDGRKVATACFDKTARVWSVATRQPIGEPFVHPKIVEDIAFSPDDTRLVTAGKLKDYDQFYPVALWGTPPFSIHANYPINTIADQKGRRIRGAGVIQIEALKALGAVTVGMPPTEIAEAINRRTIDGTTSQPTVVFDFGLDRVTSSHYFVRLGFVPLTIMMNRKKFESLPKAGQDAIRKFSQEWMAKRYNDVYSAYDAELVKRLQTDPKRTVVIPGTADREAARLAFEPLIAAWIAKSARNGELYKLVKAELELVRSAK